MGTLLRRIRAVIGTGLTWAVGWAVLTVGLLGLGGQWGMALARVIPSALGGFIIGSSFAVVLSVAERRSRLEDLSLWGVAGSGWIAGILVAGIAALSGGVTNVLYTLVYVLMVGLISGVFGAGTYMLAKRGDTKLIEGEGEEGREPFEATE